MALQANLISATGTTLIGDDFGDSACGGGAIGDVGDSGCGGTLVEF